MSKFRILAIRPRKDCHSDFLKSLKPGQCYFIHRNTKLYNFNGQRLLPYDEVAAIALSDETPEDLYQVITEEGHSFDINVSAIAGKNGAGKSTIIELLFAAFFVYSIRTGVLKGNLDDLDDYQESILKSQGFHKEQIEEIYRKVALLEKEYNESFIKREEHNKKSFESLKDDLILNFTTVEALKENLVHLKDQADSIVDRKADLQRVFSNLKVEIYYQIENDFYCLQIDDELARGYKLLKLPSYKSGNERTFLSHYKPEVIDVSKESFSSCFFYTVAVNYSQYALNADVMGEWINALFHKNDGYKTPVVINPMRDKGNFDINIEHSLSKYRLLTNLLIQQQFKKDDIPKLTDNQSVEKIIFTLNHKKIQDPTIFVAQGGRIGGERKQLKIITELFAVFFPDEELRELAREKYFPLKELLLNYIVRKVEDITKYDGFKGYTFNENENCKPFFEKLIEERSHIVFKLKQALNFLKYNLEATEEHYFSVEQELLNAEKSVTISLTVPQLLEWLGQNLGVDLINYLPPSIFSIEFGLSTNTDKLIFLHEMSSGEQQFIHTIQSVIYHLNNLVSTHRSTGKRIVYQYINLVFDEIEMYFHPDYQRKFLNELLKSFKFLCMGDKQVLKGLNIIFLTHSPFILSDISKEQVMLLEVDEEIRFSESKTPKSQTFAANINELLADSFFLEGTLMGTFAEEKIKKLIEVIKSDRQLGAKDRKLLELIGDNYLKSGLRFHSRQKGD